MDDSTDYVVSDSDTSLPYLSFVSEPSRSVIPESDAESGSAHSSSDEDFIGSDSGLDSNETCTSPEPFLLQAAFGNCFSELIASSDDWESPVLSKLSQDFLDSTESTLDVSDSCLALPQSKLSASNNNSVGLEVPKLNYSFGDWEGPVLSKLNEISQDFLGGAQSNLDVSDSCLALSQSTLSASNNSVVLEVPKLNDSSGDWEGLSASNNSVGLEVPKLNVSSGDWEGPVLSKLNDISQDFLYSAQSNLDVSDSCVALPQSKLSASYNSVDLEQPKLNVSSGNCIDLTQSDSSLLNSPVGAVRQENGVSNADMPEWEELPTADTTVSHFGRRAMQTHLTEKSLTVEALSKLHNALKSCPSEETCADNPKMLKVDLLPHQKHGLAWMMWREKEKPSGGILADDMGLGKTLSMISLVLKQKEMSEECGEDSDSDDASPTPSWLSSKYSRMPRGGTLVVCPASVMDQWEREIYKRVKKKALTVEFYHGPRRETKPHRLAKYDVIITTYSLVGRESGVQTGKNAPGGDKGPLFRIKWLRIVLDEAHVVRNHKSQMAIGVTELVGEHRWCLTGTPIQNKELDLYALLKFLRCSPFDDLVVWKRWVDNKNVAGMQRLSTMMKSLMLRRTKEQLSEKGELESLPDKTFETVDVQLDPMELEIYEKVAQFSNALFAEYLSVRTEKQQVLDARYGFSTRPVWEQGEPVDNQYTTTAELAAMHRKMKGISNIKTHHILVLLLRLRQICCHPGLISKMVSDGDLDIDGLGEGVVDGEGLDVDLFDQMNNLNINETDFDGEDDSTEKLNVSKRLTVDHPVFKFDRPSAKIRAVLDVVEEKIVGSDDKAIIVSQWTSMLDIIIPFLKQMQIKFESLTGKVPVDKRQEIMNAFNKAGKGPQVLLLSLTAGGVGLNLMGANHLLLIDIHWNPQLEAQACDRIYRLGQQKNVFIYRFITSNTVEERIKLLQDKKLQVASNVLSGTMSPQLSKLSLDDLKMLFSLPSSNPNPPGV